MFHALLYSCHIFNVLPVKGLYSNGQVGTPFELFQGCKPRISHFRVFSCPVTARKWTTSTNGNGKQTKHGIRGISIGLPENQKGYLFYSPASRQIYISGNITFNKGFTSTIATTWRLQRDTLALRPAASNIPMVTTTLEYTGDITNTLSPSDPTDVEEGEIIAHADETQTEDEDDASPPLVHDNTDVAPPPHDEFDDDCPDLVHCKDDDSVSEADPNDDDNSNSDDEELDDDVVFALEQHRFEVEDNKSPQPANLSRYGRIRRPNSRYANQARSYKWEVDVAGTKNQDLVHACATESTPILPNPGDALSWEPAPSTIRDIVKMPSGPVKEEWLKSVQKELKTLVDLGTFQEDTLHTGETSTPVMETFKVNVKSDGCLDKLKT